MNQMNSVIFDLLGLGTGSTLGEFFHEGQKYMWIF